MSVNVSESFRLRCCSVRKAPPAFEVTFSVLERILFNTLIYNHVFSFDRRDVVTVSYSPANQIVTHLSGEEMRLWKKHAGDWRCVHVSTVPCRLCWPVRLWLWPMKMPVSMRQFPRFNKNTREQTTILCAKTFSKYEQSDPNIYVLISTCVFVVSTCVLSVEIVVSYPCGTQMGR